MYYIKKENLGEICIITLNWQCNTFFTCRDEKLTYLSRVILYTYVNKSDKYDINSFDNL